MPLTRRRFTRVMLTTLGAALVPFPTLAELVQGRDWRPINPPQPGAVPGKIEVLEFFSYGCPHCGQLNPLIKPWSERLPQDVVFRRIPVTFGRAAWVNLARLYVALEQTGDLARLDQAVFDAVAKQRENLFTDEAIFAWVKGQGVALDDFKAAFSGFAAETEIKRSDALVQRYQVDSVPTIAVGGRYVVTGSGAKGYEDLLTIADGLIVMARQGA
ncbi:MAG TPA: thiol:disulfide interchange protein DsbA/DsbL [Lamprocystis sp. (in: g-proteobacteria)]|nr:thiol:disulfide interchange protein DsbA/DsbL [Lamprocystis sp. (in: g-proteobacteria)]